jgi:hypothetical protein
VDINQSPLSRYQKGSTKAVSSKDAKTHTTKVSPQKESSSDSQYAQQKMDLKESQLLRGQILDIRFQEVTISLEPDKQVITAKLSGDIPLSIGQHAQFQVVEEGNDTYHLKYLPNTSISPTEETIQKALTASLLPMTDRNKAIVSELLNHRMPIDKQTLQVLMKYSVTNREASPSTLVLMYKNKIPITASNIRQFEAYNMDTAKLTTNVTDLINHLTDINKQQSIPTNQTLLNILLSHNKETATSLPPNMIRDVLTPEELLTLDKTVEQKLVQEGTVKTHSPDLLQNIRQGLLSVNDAVEQLNNIQLNGELRSDSLSAQSIMTVLTAFDDNPSVLKLLEHYIKPSDASVLLRNLFDTSERSALTEQLKAFPLSEQISSQISSGSIDIKEILTFLKDTLPQVPNTDANALLQSPEYERLLKEAFHQKWTLTPEKLANKASVTELYQNLTEDLEQINQLARTLNASEDALRLQEPIKSTQENLHFLKDLNEMFTYLPLPIQLKNQDVHTDLYVFTKKKALKDKSDGISVLLHLDMSNLGPLNIHLQLKQNYIQAKFFPEDVKSGEYLRDNMSALTEQLHKRGYDLVAEVIASYEKPNFSKHFIEENSQDNFVQRFTFDIRT